MKAQECYCIQSVDTESQLNGCSTYSRSAMYSIGNVFLLKGAVLSLIVFVVGKKMTLPVSEFTDFLLEIFVKLESFLLSSFSSSNGVMLSPDDLFCFFFDKLRKPNSLFFVFYSSLIFYYFISVEIYCCC